MRSIVLYLTLTVANAPAKLARSLESNAASHKSQTDAERYKPSTYQIQCRVKSYPAYRFVTSKSSESSIFIFQEIEMYDVFTEIIVSRQISSLPSSSCYICPPHRNLITPSSKNVTEFTCSSRTTMSQDIGLVLVTNLNKSASVFRQLAHARARKSISRESGT